jgi:single-strand DNA-binding protein
MTRDPVVGRLVNGVMTVDVGLAVVRKWFDGGEKKEEVLFVECRGFGRLAENMSRYLSKGRMVLIEGRLRLHSWEKDGRHYEKIGVTVEDFVFLDGFGGKGSGCAKKSPDGEAGA